MNKYKCGHKGELVILDSNVLSLSAYMNWKNTVGFEGDKSMCWECYCKELNKNQKEGE